MNCSQGVLTDHSHSNRSRAKYCFAKSYSDYFPIQSATMVRKIQRQFVGSLEVLKARNHPQITMSTKEHLWKHLRQFRVEKER